MLKIKIFGLRRERIEFFLVKGNGDIIWKKKKKEKGLMWLVEFEFLKMEILMDLIEERQYEIFGEKKR